MSVVCCFQISGCASVAIEALAITADKVTANRNIDAAQAGDADAQYALGEALCCSGDAAEGTFYDTSQALVWLCRAAEQGNTDAMMKLGQIFDGDQVDGPRMMRRILTAITETPENAPAAYYWYARAGRDGHEAAAETAKSLAETMTAPEKAQADLYLEDAALPCTWADLQTAAADGTAGEPKSEPVQ